MNSNPLEIILLTNNHMLIINSSNYRWANALGATTKKTKEKAKIPISKLKAGRNLCLSLMMKLNRNNIMKVTMEMIQKITSKNQLLKIS